jgi:septum formation protein
MKPVILASGSPRRVELLKATGLRFEVRPSTIDEEKIRFSCPRERAIKAALLKATAVATGLETGVVIGADTIVCLGEEIYGKPAGRHSAEQMLRSLSGRSHRVITGLAIREAHRSTALLDSVETQVEMRHISDEEIQWYLDSGEPFDKAGAYGIQGLAGRFVARVEGCYFNVVGLPLPRLVEMLSEFIDTSSLTIPDVRRFTCNWPNASD